MGFASHFTARIDARNGVASVALAGELDMATVPVLEESLAPFEGNGIRTIMLDLRELTFLDCSALRAFLDARDRAAKRRDRLILVGATPFARRVFDLAGVGYLLDDVDAAGVLDQFTGGQTRSADKTVSLGVHADV
jgi:anti-sigma B factor antagonist